MKTCQRLCLFAGLVLIARSAFALGPGELTLNSSVDEHELKPEDIRIGLATQADFDRLSVERASYLTQVQFAVVVDTAGAGFHLTADEPLVEPASPETPSVTSSYSGSDGSAALAKTSSFMNKQKDRDVQPVPVAGGKYLVTPEDTLWNIASSAALPGISVQQTMLAIFAMNPRAFAGDNINGLMAGYVLTLPTEADLAMGVSEAIRAVKSQDGDWTRETRNQSASRVGTDSDLNPDSATDLSSDADADILGSSDAHLAADVGEAARVLIPLDASDDSPQIQDAFGTSAATNAAETMDSEEGNRASLAGIEAQLADLSGEISNLHELVAIRDRQIAELQTSMAARQKPTNALDQTKWLRWLMFCLAAICLGALALLLSRWRRLKGQSEEPAEVKGSIEQPPSSASDTVSRAAGSAASDGTPMGLDAAASEALAEAEIYVSYGRYQQAINVLSALADEGAGHSAAELYCKMIDIALESDRFEEALEWLEKVEATGSEEQVARATKAVKKKEIELSGLDGIGEEEISLKSNQQFLSGQSVTGDHAEVAALASHLPESSDEEPLAPQADRPIDSIESAGQTFDPDAVGVLSVDAETSADSTSQSESAAELGTDAALLPEQPAQLEAEGLVYATETDPMDAKLDLARAYIDMGDEEGARPILEDVVTNGDLRQQAEARDLLIHLD